MNILVYALVLVLVMSIGITARMPSTLLGVRVRSAYAEQMAQRESAALYTAAAKAYDAHHVTEATPDDAKKDTKKANGPRLHRYASLYVAIHDADSQHRRLFSDLLDALFQDEEWYRETVDFHPDIADQLLDALAGHWPETAPKKVRDLATIDLHDADLQRFLKRVLDNGLVGEDGQDLFFDLRKKERKVSIYLAREDLLLAIFNDASVVRDIVTERNRIHSEYTSERRKDLSDEFESTFGRGRYLSEDEWLDFRVSGTQPP